MTLAYYEGTCLLYILLLDLLAYYYSLIIIPVFIYLHS